MIDLNGYMKQITELLKSEFGSRLLYVGLQGSYMRGEAKESSDIDIMVILEGLTVSDLKEYRGIVKRLPYSDRSCGFICGKDDLLSWNRLELFHVLNSTKDYYGTLRDWIPAYTETDIRNYIQIELDNLYHALCHSYIHAKEADKKEILAELYKGVFFILQDLSYLDSGIFFNRKQELLETLTGQEREILLRGIDMSTEKSYDYEESFTCLFEWCQSRLQNISFDS